MSDTIDPEVENLLQFIYLMPVGVVKFRGDGTVDLLNPMASQLLTPLLPSPDLGNFFDAMRGLCHDLAAMVAGFNDRAGTILDQRRIEARAGRQNVTLSLTVTRVSDDVYMATVKDISRLSEMLAFAFAAADLLIDVNEQGMIEWAGGAFQALFGMRPQDAVGRPLDALIAPRDRDTLQSAMAQVRLHGRMSPMMLRLANRPRTRCVVAGLVPEGRFRRFFITVGPPPIIRQQAEEGVLDAREFAREAEAWLRGQPGGVLGMLDVPDWGSTAARLDSQQLDALKRDIHQLLGRGGAADAIVGEIAAGRFGVLDTEGTDMAKLGEALRGLLAVAVPGSDGPVLSRSLALDESGLSLGQSVHALRLLLSRFSGKGISADAAEPQAPSLGQLGQGLAGMLQEAAGHKRALAEIIAGGRFRMAYQPVVRLAGRAVHHYEALLRPEAGPQNPAGNPQEFVTMVEAVGLATMLDEAVLRQGTAPLRGPGADVAVNISGLSIADPGFVDRLLRGLSALPAGRLLLELTETAEVADLAQVAAHLQRIRAAGVRVCLDDFGAGQACFRYLRELEVDFVKIDGAYVRAARHSGQDRAFVKAMREMADASGAQTIAEMIETEEDAAMMQELGVGFGQGWFFGRPGPLPAVPPAEMGAKLGRWRY